MPAPEEEVGEELALVAVVPVILDPGLVALPVLEGTGVRPLIGPPG